MRKSLLAVAVLGAFAANAMAADVTLYGKVDTGLMYTNKKVGDEKAKNTVEMKGGIIGQSRWGLKGTEDLGNGYKVGFVLENGFSSDTGAAGQSGKLFGREATINVSGPFGTVYAGRMGGVGGGSATSPVSLWSMGSAFSTVWGNNSLAKTLQSNADRYDNSLAYVTPNFGGFQVIAFYSMGGDEATYKDKKENSEEVERYYGLGAKYVNGPVAVFGVVDQMNYANGLAANEKNDDSLAVTLGGSYDFAVAKVYATAQYFDNLMSRGSISNDTNAILNFGKGEQMKGWALSLSTNVPLAGGNFKAQIGYADAEHVDDSKNKGKRYAVGVGYQYPLSKRTSLYAGASYMQDKYEGEDAVELNSGKKTKTTQAFFGLQHNF